MRGGAERAIDRDRDAIASGASVSVSMLRFRENYGILFYMYSITCRLPGLDGHEKKERLWLSFVLSEYFSGAGTPR